MKSRLLSVLGVMLLAAGLLFASQGAGLIPWPPESFMIGQRAWIEYGAAIALAGLALLVLARRT